MEYLFLENFRFIDARKDIVSMVTKSGTLYIFDLKGIKNVETVTETTVEPKDTNVTNEANNTIISTGNDVNENKETVNTTETETKNTPGFELPAILSGSLLAAYILNKRKR